MPVGARQEDLGHAADREAADHLVLAEVLPRREHAVRRPLRSAFLSLHRWCFACHAATITRRMAVTLSWLRRQFQLGDCVVGQMQLYRPMLMVTVFRFTRPAMGFWLPSLV